MSFFKRNERDWAGQLISWLKEAVNNGATTFEDVTNDTGIKLSSGRTKYPDILLFSDKTSGIIFNGWELKFPDTAVDDTAMLKNALEKAQRIHSDSFVTWNGAEAVIWKIDTEHYSVETISILKRYPKVPTIQVREDLADPHKYSLHEPHLHQRALEILHDLDMLRRSGAIREAIDVSGNIIQAIKSAQRIIVPQFTAAIVSACRTDIHFRQQFNTWKIYESATLNILRTSSRRAEIVDEKHILAQFAFYNLIGKIIFYLTLSENLPKELPPISIDSTDNLRQQLYYYFDKAKAIDYQAVFMPYFTDGLDFSDIVNTAVLQLLETLAEFDFKILPSEVIGTILENLVPNDEKQKFGQYFTPTPLANLVAFPAVQTKNATLFDPTAGTGTFLNSFYHILRYFGNTCHQDILNQIWGNDISHFPAILSVINLYKHDVTQTDNFPKVTRDDFFNLSVGKSIEFPKPLDHSQKIAVSIPRFDGIASNFPFIQQEDIPNEDLTDFFKREFGSTQAAFITDGNFDINKRADYYTYCTFNALRFIKDGGIISVITSNAWLGKEYGIQFKHFLLDNFHIKYVVRSTAEHWFNNSFVSTVFIVLQRISGNDKPTKFVSLNFKLSDYFKPDDINAQLAQIEDLYAQIDHCQSPASLEWVHDRLFQEVYHNADRAIDVAIIKRQTLADSLEAKTNWAQFFIAANPLAAIEPYMIQYAPDIIKVIRGERTGWNPMFIIRDADVPSTGIDSKYLLPYIKTPAECSTIEFDGNFNNRIFVCADSIEDLDGGTKKWIQRFESAPNKNGSATVSEACSGHKPYWYSLSPKTAHIITAINPYERLFFTYSPNPFIIDQRLIALQVQNGYDVELVAALLNHVTTFLSLELAGTSRNLGALDLNANFLKNVRLLNPKLLTKEKIKDIKAAFKPIKGRKIESLFEELHRRDRIRFDRVIFDAFGITTDILPPMYDLLQTIVRNRTTMKGK